LPSAGLLFDNDPKNLKKGGGGAPVREGEKRGKGEFTKREFNFAQSPRGILRMGALKEPPNMTQEGKEIGAKKKKLQLRVTKS